MKEIDRDIMIDNVTDRVAQNILNMNLVQRWRYIRNLIKLLDDEKLIISNFAVEMTPNEKEG